MKGKRKSECRCECECELIACRECECENGSIGNCKAADGRGLEANEPWPDQWSAHAGGAAFGRQHAIRHTLLGWLDTLSSSGAWNLWMARKPPAVDVLD